MELKFANIDIEKAVANMNGFCHEKNFFSPQEFKEKTNILVEEVLKIEDNDNEFVKKFKKDIMQGEYIPVLVPGDPWEPYRVMTFLGEDALPVEDYIERYLDKFKRDGYDVGTWSINNNKGTLNIHDYCIYKNQRESKIIEKLRRNDYFVTLLTINDYPSGDTNGIYSKIFQMPENFYSSGIEVFAAIAMYPDLFDRKGIELPSIGPFYGNRLSMGISIKNKWILITEHESDGCIPKVRFGISYIN